MLSYRLMKTTGHARARRNRQVRPGSGFRTGLLLVLCMAYLLMGTSWWQGYLARSTLGLRTAPAAQSTTTSIHPVAGQTSETIITDGRDKDPFQALLALRTKLLHGQPFFAEARHPAFDRASPTCDRSAPARACPFHLRFLARSVQLLC